MTWNRVRRLEALLQERIATIIAQKLSDPRIGFTTITRVELSRDKKLARVYYTALGEPERVRTTRRGLEAAAPHIQEALAPHFQARNLPELRFVYDESVRREADMLHLLDELAVERAARPAPPEGPAGEPPDLDGDEPGEEGDLDSDGEADEDEDLDEGPEDSQVR